MWPHKQSDVYYYTPTLQYFIQCSKIQTSFSMPAGRSESSSASNRLSSRCSCCRLRSSLMVSSISLSSSAKNIFKHPFKSLNLRLINKSQKYLISYLEFPFLLNQKHHYYPYTSKAGPQQWISLYSLCPFSFCYPPVYILYNSK